MGPKTCEYCDSPIKHDPILLREVQCDCEKPKNEEGNESYIKVI